MEELAAALIYLGFFALIGFAVWLTTSAWPLWALLLTPTIRTTNCDCDEEA